jgi:outer membrane protein OmpA-like peptidoglycan-associated protein/opacity protein-like surface antigen
MSGPRPLFRITAIAFTVGSLVCAPRHSSAQVNGPHITLTPYAGGMNWDKKVNLNDRPVYGGRVGLMFSKYFGVEGAYDRVDSRTKAGGTPWTEPDPGTTMTEEFATTRWSVGLIANLAPHNKVSPYLIGGFSRIKFDSKAEGVANENDNGFDLGAGIMVRIVPRVHLRIEGRDVGFRFHNASNPYGNDLIHNIWYTGGLQFALGGHPWSATPPVVADSDNDGVPDKTDQCPNTPAGCTVDANGCPKDADNDSVCDGVDQCPNTPAGTQVNAQGCPMDADNDGVPDGIDKCPNTLAGCRVDATGCDVDSDGDGVCDGLDKCENTPKSARVDKDGCPIEVSEKETELLDTGKIVVNNIHFETAKWDILPEDYKVLDEIGNILVNWPQLKIEVGGHTDSRGSVAYNHDLSHKRAQSVLDYLLEHFPQINRDQYTAVGYGELRPIATNKTVEGMARNRRVEFKVLNTEVLKQEREKRKMLEKNEEHK